MAHSLDGLEGPTAEVVDLAQTAKQLYGRKDGLIDAWIEGLKRP